MQLKLNKDNNRILDKIGKYRIISDSDTKSLETIKKSIDANITLFNSVNTIYCKLAGIDFTIFVKYIQLISIFVKVFMMRWIEWVSINSRIKEIYSAYQDEIKDSNASKDINCLYFL